MMRRSRSRSMDRRDFRRSVRLSPNFRGPKERPYDNREPMRDNGKRREHHQNEVRLRKRTPSPPVHDRQFVRMDSAPRNVPPPDVPEDRLTRLEKMVEMLVQQNSNIQKNHHTERHNSDIPEFLPRNTNFTTSMWLNAVENEAIRQNLDERRTLALAKDQMTGVLKAWYSNLNNFTLSWQELKHLIVKTFPDNRNFADTLERMVARKKVNNETWTVYFFSKLYLLDACKITGADAVSCIIAGLNDPHYQQEAENRNYLNPEALFTMYLSKLPTYEPPPPDISGSADAYEYDSRHISSTEDCRRRIENKKKFYRK